jgi:hypothetical protein
MSSPFSTIEAFEGAADGATEGAIYTFANSPAVNVIVLVIGVGLFCWFIVKTFSTHADLSGMDKSLNSLSVLLVAGLLSLPGVVHRQGSASIQATAARPETVVAQSSVRAPVGLMGLLGLGVFKVGHTQRRDRARRYRNNSFR